MSVVFRYPRRPPWLYPAGTIIRTHFGHFRVSVWNAPDGGFSMREWRGMPPRNCERCKEGER